MSPPRPFRKARVVILGLALTTGLTLSLRAEARAIDPAFPVQPFETMATVHEASTAVMIPGSAAAQPAVGPARPRARVVAQGREVRLDGKLVFRYASDDGTHARVVAQRLETLMRQGALRSDRVTPARRGKRYVVSVGPVPVIEVDDALARREGETPSALTLRYVNALRQALGGMPIQVQASRGLLPGVRSGVGVASWYGGAFHGRRAASGERFDMHAYTAAHRTLPFGTLLLVTNIRNGKTALVRITDRGPYAHGRTLDLSRGAAEALGMLGAGVARVRYAILK